mmetsp:Transcript_58388/g.125625  ORF Transcript_58388/g.125625 Transcript_58388/m.125625 type:complete len:538 (+) Transcript_58388:135-1748(+)
MRLFAAALAAGLASRAGLRRGQDADVDFDGDDENAAYGVWIPVQPASGKAFYYNPTRGFSVRKLPRGAVLTSTGEVNHDNPFHQPWGKAVAPKIIEASPIASTSHAPASDKKDEKEKDDEPALPATIVPLDQRKSCVPHCAWKCTEPVCEQNCKPICGVPKCETRCPKLGSSSYKGCKVKCGEPNCAMFCPEKNICNGTKTLDCNTPKCATRCENPKCTMDCGHNGMGCKTVCPEPKCEWHCQRPKECPRPECSMQCEQPPECAIGKNIAVPPPREDGYETVSRSRSAVLREAKWVVGEWGGCTTQCGYGYRHRHIRCTSPAEQDCEASEPRPQNTTSCETYDGCDWTVGGWSPCSARCGTGKRHRSVRCQGPRCQGRRPASETQCQGNDPTCEMCKVIVYGGKEFDGWDRTFEEGEYNAAELEYEGVKCDDISSLEVIGVYCEVKAYEFGDFNAAHKGWVATFKEGKFNKEEMEQEGARNNDMSSFVVAMKKPEEDHPHNHTKHMGPIARLVPALRGNAESAGVASILLAVVLLRL